MSWKTGITISLAFALATASSTEATAATYVRDAGGRQYPGIVERIEARKNVLPSGEQSVELRFYSKNISFGIIAIGPRAFDLISGTPPPTLRRYILMTGTARHLEFRHRDTHLAFLPYSFSLQPDLVLPTCLGRTGDFRRSTSFLGAEFTLSQRAGEDPIKIPVAEVVELSDDVLVGTSRNFRDINKGRIPTERFFAKGNNELDYTYRPLDKSDLARMVKAGFNYFDRVLPAQIEFLYDKPVFFDIEEFASKPRPIFPEILFHPGFLGVEDFIDEPAWVFWSETAALAVADNIEDMGRLQERVTREVIERQREGRPRGLTVGLAQAGILLEGVELREPSLPVWEEFYSTACYQMRTPVAGFIHEGRYQHPETVDLLNRTFRTALPRRPETVFLFYNAFLRGTARVFRKEWGISIYGQADPDIALLGMRMAYDRGAHYVWFWTSDRDHHLPFEEQLALASAFTAYVAKHPRASRSALIRGAKDAIVLPYGFTFSVSDWDKSEMADLWHRACFSIRDGRTEDGTAYYAVLRCATEKMAELIRAGREFDILVETPELESAGYERIHRVLLQAAQEDYEYPWWLGREIYIGLAVLVAFLLAYRIYRIIRWHRRRKADGSTST